jgi:hypothetical protein
MMDGMLLSGSPSDDVGIPGAIRRLGGGQRLKPIWQNGLGGLTFQVGAGPSRRFVKWAPVGMNQGAGRDLSRLLVVIVWINGAVAGKTTTARAVIGRLRDTRLVNR